MGKKSPILRRHSLWTAPKPESLFSIFVNNEITCHLKAINSSCSRTFDRMQMLIFETSFLHRLILFEGCKNTAKLKSWSTYNLGF